MTIKVDELHDYDVAHDCTIGEFLDALEKYGATMTSFVANGPGGGNPCVTLGFEDEEKRQAFEAWYNYGDAPANPVIVVR
jgi:hypothetical protein